MPNPELLDEPTKRNLRFFLLLIMWAMAEVKQISKSVRGEQTTLRTTCPYEELVALCRSVVLHSDRTTGKGLNVSSES